MNDTLTKVSQNGTHNGTAEGEFSPKEKEVLYWLSEGYSSKLIAAQMNLTKDTVETHRKRIFKKMNVTNVAMAIAYGFRHNLLK